MSGVYFINLSRYIYDRALQFIPAPTSPWLVKETIFTRQPKYVTCQVNKYTNSSYITSICIYLHIIINPLNETEHAQFRNGLLKKFCWNHIETFFMFQTFIKKNNSSVLLGFLCKTSHKDSCAWPCLTWHCQPIKSAEYNQ